MKKILQKKAFSKLESMFSSEKILENSILIVFDSSFPENERIILSWLKSNKQFTTKMLIGLELQNRNPKATIFPILGKKDMTWYGSLKPDAIFRVKPDFNPDVILVLDNGKKAAIDAWIDLIPANIKIGHAPQLPIYNLILEKFNGDYSRLFSEIDKFLPKVELIGVY